MVIPGLLQNSELHSYEIKQIIEERKGDWTSIAFGSMYFAVGKLAEKDSIYFYSRGDRGVPPEEFRRLLAETFRQPERNTLLNNRKVFMYPTNSFKRSVRFYEKSIIFILKLPKLWRRMVEYQLMK